MIQIRVRSEYGFPTSTSVISREAIDVAEMKRSFDCARLFSSVISTTAGFAGSWYRGIRTTTQ